MTSSNVARAAAVFAMGCAGCVSQPSMSLHGARVSQANLAGVELAMTMSVRNDNAFDVLVRTVRADVVVARQLALPTVQTQPNVWLRAKTSTLVVVPVTVPWQSVPQLIQVTLGSSSIPYHAWGSADVTATRALEIDVDDYAFDQEGALAREELVSAASRGMLGGFLPR